MSVIKVQTSFAKGKEKYETVTTSCPFATAIIDPDWPYTVAPGREHLRDVKDLETKGRLSGFTRNKDGNNQYLQKKPLSIEELKALPIDKWVGGYILLWTVGPFLINGAAKEVLDAWGFVPSSILTWAKYDLENSHGYGGVGFWFLGNAEFCIVAKRSGWPSIRTGRSSLWVEPKKGHSSKPDNAHQLCETRFPGPYLEIFGRNRRPNWLVLGDEAHGDGGDVRDTLKNVTTLRVAS